MTEDQYMDQLLAREAVDNGPFSDPLSVQTVLAPIIQSWAGNLLRGMKPSGSWAKGTANKSGTDIDLFISLDSTTAATLKEIYDTLFERMKNEGYQPKRQNVSINVQMKTLKGLFDVDLTPGRQQPGSAIDHSIYVRKRGTWTKTNVDKHIEAVRLGGRIRESRYLKLWRNRLGLDFPSFYLELTVINALYGKYGTTARNVMTVFDYLRDSFPNARVVDPANSANILSDDLTAIEKAAVKNAAATARNATDWNHIVPL